MTLIAGRYQPFDTPRPGAPQRARDLETAQTVLLRSAPLPEVDPAGAVARAHMTRRVFHPSLLTLFDVMEQPDGRLLLAYEYVPAQPILRAAGGGGFHPRHAAELVVQVADAVAELHAREIAHGGVSVETVLVTMKGKAKLDRAGEPGFWTPAATVEGDLAGLAGLLDTIVARPPGSGIPAVQAIDTIIARARGGGFESVAAFAGMLRRV